MRRFDTVIFDLDGLICDTEPLYRRATNLALAAAGANYQFGPEEYGHLLVGKSVRLNSEYMRQRFHLEATAIELERATLALFAVLISDPRNLEPMPGLHVLLDYLKRERIPAGVASGSRPEHVALVLNGLGLREAFQVAAGSDDTVARKPAPDIYRRALGLLGADASHTIAIEDSLSGIQSARAAGLFAIAVRNEYTRSHDLSEANLICANLAKVRDFLEKEG